MNPGVDNAAPAAPSRGPVGAFYHALMQVCGFVAGLIIAIISVVIVYNVVSRNLGLGSLGWVLEGSEYAVAVATFLGAPWVLYQGSHVRIDLLLNVLPRAVGRWLEALVNLLGTLICSAFAYFLWSAGSEHFERGTRVFKAFVFPEWWTFITPVFCLALLTIEFARRLWRSAALGEI
ncbi:MAG: TRAP transporter small permease [Aquisalimonadaceae bacterium]